MVFASNYPGVRTVAGAEKVARGRRDVDGLMGDTKTLEIKGHVTDWLHMGVRKSMATRVSRWLQQGGCGTRVLRQETWEKQI